MFRPSSLLLTLLASQAVLAAHAQFAAGDQVKLVRDEELQFKGAKYRIGKAGETFNVIDYRPQFNKVFILSKDAAGKDFALSVSDTAVTVLPKDGTALDLRAIDAMRAGKFDDARTFFEQAAQADPAHQFHSKLGAQAVALGKAVLQLGTANAEAKQLAPELDRRRRNANVADRPNPLMRDNSNQVRASGMRAEADRMEERAKQAIEAGQRRFEGELKAAGELSEELQTHGAYSVLLAWDDALAGLRAAHAGGPERYGSSSSRVDRARLAKSVATANEALEQARGALNAQRLIAATGFVETALKAEPGRMTSHHLQAEIRERRTQADQLVAEATELQAKKDFAQALEKIYAATKFVADDAKLDEMVQTLRTTIAEKSARLKTAEAQESAGEYAQALEAYELYGVTESTNRVLPVYARAQEQAGNFLLAYQLFEKAGLGEEMKRVKARTDQQVAKYSEAETALAEERFDEALAIYDSYKDQTARCVALQRKGAARESAGKDADALEAYREAGAAKELARLKETMAEKSRWLTEAENAEKAANWQNAIEMYRKAGSKDGLHRVSLAMAKDAEGRKDFAAAADAYEEGGMYEEAGAIRRAHPGLEAAVSRNLTPQQIFAKCGPATVTVVSVLGEDHFGQGSGFFVAKGGYIITNSHVVKDARKIGVITPSGKFLAAEVLKRSEKPDLAILKASISDHPVLKLGNSDGVKTGARVFAIGTPDKLPQSFNDGMVSQAERMFADTPCFQINVLINHGNSGGPLLDEQGQVVGINTFGRGTALVLEGVSFGSDVQGINFAIKINEALPILKGAGL